MPTSLAAQTLTCAERVWSNSYHHLVSNTPRISWRVNWFSDKWRRMAFQSGQNCQQFSWAKPVPISWLNTYFYGQNSHFCCQNWFLNVQTYKFSRSRNILVTKFLGQSPFHSNAKFSCSTLFHSNFMLNSVPFQQHFMVSHDFMVSDSLDLPEVSHAFLLTFGIVWAFTGNR